MDFNNDRQTTEHQIERVLYDSKESGMMNLKVTKMNIAGEDASVSAFDDQPRRINTLRSDNSGVIHLSVDGKNQDIISHDHQSDRFLNQEAINVQ